MVQKCSLWKVLEVFFNEPLKIHYIKQISKQIDLAPTSVKNHLLHLLKDSIIIKKKGERFFGYMANRDNEEFLFYKKTGNLMSLHRSGFLKTLKELLYPKAVVLYGSYARGEDVETSDVDIFILSNTQKAFDVKKYELLLNRRIHLIMEKDMKKLTEELKSEIINGITLYGYLKI